MGLFDKLKKKREMNQEKNSTSEAVNAVTETKPEISEPVKAVSEEKKSDFNITVDQNSPIYGIRKIYCAESGIAEMFDPLESIKPVIIKEKKKNSSDSGEKLEKELKKFIAVINKHCEALAVKIKNEKKAAENSGKKPEKTAVNAEPLLYITHNKTMLWAAVIPPLNGGKDINAETLSFRMDSLSIKHGIDKDVIEKIISEKQYLKIFLLAQGREAVHGKNGSIKNLFSENTNKINIKEDNNGNVNYKELNMIQSIHKGDTICEIIFPTEGINGIAVTGEIIQARDGKMPVIPAGKNTELTEDKTLLVAKIDGEVVYEDKKFHVRDLLTIENDVDNAVGNINFTGNVLIKGGVREGYSVSADGDIRIVGTVEGATVIAGGNLTLDRGMTGGSKGVIEVQGALKCRYLENCTVYAKKGIEAEQIIYSSLSTDENITVVGKKGTVTGGRLVVGGVIEAETIGADSNATKIKTEIVLGAIPHLIEEEKTLEHQLEECTNNLRKMTQDIKYIQSNLEKATAERKELLKKLLFQYQVDSAQKTKIEEKFEEVRQQIQSNTEKCGMKCDCLYPIVSLNVCGSVYNIERPLRECRVTRKDNNTYITSPDLEELIVF